MGYLFRLLLLGLLVFLGYRRLVRWLSVGKPPHLREGGEGPVAAPPKTAEGRPMTDQPIEEADYEELP